MKIQLLRYFWLPILCVIGNIATAYGQTLPVYYNRPSSPTAANFLRYGEIPVDMSSGVPNISIPLLEIASGKLKIPVTLSYHASGIKVRDVSSEVGIGWVINTGGNITRTICGRPDIESDDNLFLFPYRTKEAIDSAYHQANGSGNSTSFVTDLFNYAYYNSALDLMSDRFNFTLPNGKSGVFRRDFKTGNAYLIPYQPIKVKINPNNLPQGEVTKQILIIDDDGTSYLFERATNFNAQTWSVKKIISADQEDTISFYSHTESIGYSSFNDYIIYYDVNNYSPYPSYYDRSEARFRYSGGEIFGIESVRKSQQDLHYGNDYYFDYPYLMDSIVTKSSTLKFEYALDRQDRQLSGYPNPISRLTGIKAIDRSSGHIVTNVNLFQSYKDNRMLLDQVVNNGNIHSFGYDQTTAPPYPTLVYGNVHSTVSEDFWGYSNGMPTSSYVPEFNKLDVPNQTYEFITKYPNINFAKMLVLNRISYPTGGKTLFEYELNQVDPGVYNYQASDKPIDGRVGGLRVKTISNFKDSISLPEVKSYEYFSKPHYDYGLISPSLFQYREDTYNYSIAGQIYHPANANLHVSTSAPYCTSTPIGRMIGTSQAPVIYDQVTEYNGTPSNNTGKTVHYYTENFSSPFISSRFESPYTYDNGNVKPRLVRKEDYKFQNGNYILVSSNSILYNEYKNITINTGLNFSSELTFNPMQLTPISYTPPEGYVLINGADDAFSRLIHENTTASLKVMLPFRERHVTNHESGDSTIIEHQYSYNDYLQLAEEKRINSDQTYNFSVSKYPVDFSTASPYDGMVSRNILKPVIEKQNYLVDGNSTIFLSSMRHNFSYWQKKPVNYSTARIYPLSLLTKNGSYDYETEIDFKAYDIYGNLSHLDKKGLQTSYLYSYMGQHPIAEIKNANYNIVEQLLGGEAGVKHITNSNLTDSQVNSIVNILRNSSLLKDAFIISYTYKPLVGMTSMTDAKGMTTYYHYDAFGRLQFVKDQDGNVVKQNTYHYKN
ncbi:hypothetical protein EA772_01455 [Pedobacter sp. G11]|uniref:RHS repeat protein n=1 Tax=Pedobacter sp. G11 TaxID=2482728 RepID=UPI000F5DDB86|nr:RHS repeat protein [Pedobacter sp. G11]AZI24072.1 hypothetical protein EA772_01455 [Pedobacter sp. G11]